MDEPVKRELWRNIATAIPGSRDNYGRAVDHPLHDLLVALNALELPTVESSFGNPSTGGFPYVVVWLQQAMPLKQRAKEVEWYIPDTKEPEIIRVWQEITELVLPQRLRLVDLLDGFYSGGSSRYDVRIVLHGIDAPGVVVECQGSHLLKAYKAETKRTLVSLYQQEFLAFGEYLKTYFFSH